MNKHQDLIPPAIGLGLWLGGVTLNSALGTVSLALSIAVTVTTLLSRARKQKQLEIKSNKWDRLVDNYAAGNISKTQLECARLKLAGFRQALENEETETTTK